MKRPISVTILSWVLITAGAVGLFYHITELKTLHPFPYDTLLIELIRLLAVVAGICMLRASNWARWLAIVWIAFHVGVSYFHSWGQMAVHAVILTAFVFVLFRRNAAEYFRVPQTGDSIHGIRS